MPYLDHFPEPLLNDLIQNRCVPFVGAGFSKNAVVQDGDAMPLWEEVGQTFAAKIPGYRYQGALDAISAYEHEFSRVSLVEELANLLLLTTSQPGAAHHAFARMPFDVVCSTNFDMLLERSYEGVGRYCRPVVEEDQLSVGSPDTAVTLLKFHGDLHHPSRMVLTEDDYSAFLSRFPLFATYIANLLIARTPLFLGYSLDDPDFRLVWHLVRDRLGTLRRLGYTIKVNAPAWEVSRFERRGVRVINIPGSADRYPEIFEEVFDELRSYWESSTATAHAATEDDRLAELMLPDDSATRICAFLVPADSISFYRRHLYPAAKEFGFTPVSLDDLVRPGDSIPAALSTIVQRAEMLVLDVSSSSSLFEAGYVFHQRDDLDRILVVTLTPSELPFEWASRVRMIRPETDEELEAFIEDVRGWFRTWAEQMYPALEQEPRRLLEKREYRSAVISAIALFEHQLRLRFRVDELEQASRRYHSLSRLIKEADVRGAFLPREAARANDWIRVRNEMVHRQGDVSARVAKTIVEGVLSIIQRWRGQEF